MSSKKRIRATYSDDSDDDLNATLVHEEQTTFRDNRAKKKVAISKYTTDDIILDIEATLKCPLSEKPHLYDNDNNDNCDFYSSCVDEIAASDHSSVIVPPESESSDDESTGDLDDSSEEVSPVRTRVKSLEDFRELQAEFLDQFMRRYCPKSMSDICGACGTEGPIILCSECFSFQTRCQDCTMKAHRHLPLHRLQYFDGSAWRKTTLCSLGLTVNFGHNGDPCPASSEGKKITVIDIKGMQDVTVLFCSCQQLFGVDATERSQLINHGWYPATTEHPGTVATFGTLDAFEVLSGEGKLSGFHFYKSIVRMKDGAGIEDTPRRYEELMRMIREYQYLKLLLRAGKATHPEKPLSIADCELAVQCPACPHPGQNLPEDWEKKVDSWIYTLFIMIDANFCLKSKKKRTAIDIPLGGGYSYFIRREPYMEHLGNTVDEKEIKYCTSGLRAVDHANLKGGRGYHASGVVGVQCRHMLIRNNGFGDLQKGEKYANVDYVVLASLRGLEVNRVVLSYDIACQYSRNFSTRMVKYDKNMQLDLSKLDVEFVIPQFHIAGHGQKCRTRFNLRYREHVGRTDGENIERGWAGLNPLSMASKEMAIGARQDYLDWHIGDWNYQRIITFGSLFSRKLVEAVNEGVKHSKVLLDFRKAFTKGVIKEIEETIRVWDSDPMHSVDPYTDMSNGKLLSKTHRSLTQSEMMEEGASLLYAANTTETQWLVVGLELEDELHITKLLYKRSSKEASGTAVEKNAVTLRKLRIWKSEQLSHMPRVVNLPGWQSMLDNDSKGLRCWKFRLYMPSSIPSQQRRLVCPSGLQEKEYKLRIAQAIDSLAELRHLIQKLWWMMKKKKKHVSGPGQKLNTKSNLAIETVLEQREKQVARYRRARNALAALKPEGQWQDDIRDLRDEDVRHFEDNEGKGEGRRSPSWIWAVEGATSSRYKDDGDIHAGLKVEYAKARARTSRWLEEASLIREEMRRVICYFNYKIKWWIDRNERLKCQDGEAALGSIVYGNGQVLILQNLGNKF